MLMTTGKRQIPINNGPGGQPRAASERQNPETVAHAGTSPKETPGAGAAGAHRKTAAASDMSAAERSNVAAERDALKAERDSLMIERDALTDQLLRLRAEFENFRKRASREAIESHVRTQCEVLNDFLPVLDNLERALDAAEHHEEGKVLAGVRMTRNMFADLLARAGVEEIEGVGVQFDPQVHDAMLVQPSGQEEGAVAAVLERGYRRGDRVLRPARVVVSAGRAESDGTDHTATTSPESSAGGVAGSHGAAAAGTTDIGK